jgi:hypothetical protein
MTEEANLAGVGAWRGGTFIALLEVRTAVMMNNPRAAERVPVSTPVRTAAVVTMQPLQHGLESDLRGGGFALVLIRSLAHAYLDIKRVAPDLIIVYLSGNHDDAGCQLLSMLKSDVETSAVPLWTHVTERSDYRDDDSNDPDIFSQPDTGQLN